jgi:hypothetical protein
LEEEPLPSMLGNTIGGADATDMKDCLRNVLAHMPPKDNFAYNEKEENINEGEAPPSGIFRLLY